MKLGGISFMTEHSITPMEIACTLEQAGFESFWAGDHSHIPIDPTAAGPPLDTRTGRPVPPEYWQLLAPFLALTAAAVSTTRLRLGTGICLVNERDVIHTAKEVATLDSLSGGRVLFGIGGGWNADEVRNHGGALADRWPSMRERVLAMKRIWADDTAEFDGDHVRFGPLRSRPKPVSDPHPPILLGGNHRNIARAVDYGDGWCPGTPDLSDEEVTRLAAQFREQAQRAGRPELSMTAFHVPSLDGLGPGSPTALSRRRFDVLAAAGFERVVVLLPPERDACLRMVEFYERELPDRDRLAA